MLKSLLPAFALGLAACSGAPQAQTSPTQSEATLSSPLLLERLYQSPSLSGASPRALAFSPDGKLVTFLKPRADDSARLDLWAFDVATGEASMLVDSRILEPEDVELSEEEKALRERQRIAGVKGIARYDWGTATTILVPIGGDLHLIDLSSGTPEARQLTQTDAFEYDAKISPAGNYVSFIRDGALYAIALATGKETQISPDGDASKALSYGTAEFVAQEEMSRYTGYWWSTDDAYVAYTRVDESTVDIVPRFDIAADSVSVIEQRYPKAGRPNAVVDLFVRDMGTGDAVEVEWRRDDWGPATDQYLARVNWRYTHSRQFQSTSNDDFPPTYSLTIQRVDRDQKVLERFVWSIIGGKKLDTARVGSGETEIADTWINLSFDDRNLVQELLYSSEMTGFRHIYATISAEARRFPITSGDWAVSSVAFAQGRGTSQSPGQELVYFTGYKDTPLERHLYLANRKNPSEPTRITPLGSSWSITMSPDGQSYIGTSSSPSQPPQTGLYKADGTLITWIEENRLDESHPYFPYLDDHTTPDYGTLKAEDGQDLYYSIQLPPNFDPEQKYPALVEVYGGPHVQTVTRNWERMSDQFYSREGYIVFRLDNRGSDNRGRKFEDAIYRRTGGPEVRDQLVGVDYLKSLPYVDADRIGIQGWSYGGYMTLMTLLQAPEGTFAAAVSGAPVTDWALYDTFYTERYMDTPQDNPDGYKASSVFPYLDNLNSPLLLIHGMADDNVVFENSTRLYAELQRRGKHFEMMTYPGQRHGIRGEELQTHLMRSRMAFLNRHLKPGE
jgi:dipeptidyl-peptidase-4